MESYSGQLSEQSEALCSCSLEALRQSYAVYSVVKQAQYIAFKLALAMAKLELHNVCRH